MYGYSDLAGMSGVEIIVRLAVVAMLAGWLLSKQRRRMRTAEVQYDPAEWTGHTIDVSSLKPKLEAVRRNHLAACPPNSDIGFHHALLHLARRFVLRLPYFQRRGTHPDDPLISG
jgi:hypothetical protein